MLATTTTELPDHRYRLETGGCPIEAVMDVIGGRWKALLLFRLGKRPARFNALRKSLPHVSSQMLVRQLRELERDGLVRRTAAPDSPAKVEYAPTAAALALMPLLIGLRDWGARHLLGLSGEALAARLEACGWPPLPEAMAEAGDRADDGRGA